MWNQLTIILVVMVIGLVLVVLCIAIENVLLWRRVERLEKETRFEGKSYKHADKLQMRLTRERRDEYYNYLNGSRVVRYHDTLDNRYEYVTTILFACYYGPYGLNMCWLVHLRETFTVSSAIYIIFIQHNSALKGVGEP